MPLFDTHVNQPCLCVPEDIGAQFSDCSGPNNTRQVIYFWRPPATCIGGTLPDPVDGIPCNLVCGPGTFLNVTTKQCEPCLAGSYGDGGGYKWTQWSEWPAQFRTYCIIGGNPTRSCSPWRLFGETIDSGDNYNLHYLQSILEFRVQLVRPGSISFNYRVSAEQGFDGLWFVVNNLGIFFRSNSDWVYYTRNLNPGFYTIQWQYYKDYSITSGEDRVQISSIEVVGTTFAEVSCNLCPLGWHQDIPMSNECKPCIPGTYSDILGATTCKSCGVGQTSYYGSSSCFFQRACNSSFDYSYNYSKCINGQRTKQYVWIEPASCNKNNSVLPPSVVEPCVPDSCLPGQFYNLNTQQCEYCPIGSSSSGSSCTPCSPGSSASHRNFYVTEWGSWNTYNNSLSPVTISTGCKGSCFQGNGGWRLAQWFTDSGTANGVDSRSWLLISTSVLPGATIQFNYSLPCQVGDYLAFSINDQPIAEYDCQQTTNDCAIPSFNTSFLQIAPSPSSNAPQSISVNLQWTFWKTTPTTVSSCDRAIISGIAIQGIYALSGGSDVCATCPAGTYSLAASGSCIQCPIGNYSSSSASSCQSCPTGTFADDKGSQSCIPCGLGTENSDKSGCIYNCSSYSLLDIPTNKTYHYNLTPFQFFQIPYIQSNNGSAITYQINGSLCGWNGQCADNQGNQINSFVCVSSDALGNTVNLGKTLQIYPYIDSTTFASSPYSGVSFQVSNGDANCQFILNIKCSSNAGVGSPSPISESDWNRFVSTCMYVINWSSSYGCPLCTDDDFSFYDTECIDGSQQRNYFWTNTNCFGGIALPSPTILSCDAHIKVQVSAIVAVVLSTVFTLAIALGVIFYLYRKNKKLYASYHQLKNEQIPMEEEKN